jgi:hypothetical protein
MERRAIKQILYGAGYLLVLFLIISGIYLIWLKPAPSCFDGRQNQGELGVDCGGPCQPCEIQTLTPLQISWLKNFPVDKNTIIAAEIKNPNLNWGAENFSYTFRLYDIYDNEIYTLTKKSFIYSGEVKFIVEPNVNVEMAQIGNIAMSFSSINWKPQAEFPRPETQLRGLKTESGPPIRISGLFLNNNPYGLSRANVLGFIYNQKGDLISASKTELGKTGAFEESSFQITFPQNISPKIVDSNLTKLYVEAVR